MLHSQHCKEGVRGQQKQLHMETSKSISISFSAVFHSCTSVDFVSFLISLIVLHSSSIFCIFLFPGCTAVKLSPHSRHYTRRLIVKESRRPECTSKTRIPSQWDVLTEVPNRRWATVLERHFNILISRRTGDLYGSHVDRELLTPPQDTNMICLHNSQYK